MQVMTAQTSAGLHKRCFQMKRPAEIQPPGISFSCCFSRLSNPSCRLISFAHLWNLLLSASCTRQKSRLSASVNLLILYRMEPLRGKRMSPQNEALRDLFETRFFFSFFFAQHSSNVTQIPLMEEWLFHPQVCFRCIYSHICALCVTRFLQAQLRSSRGRLNVIPGCVLRREKKKQKTLATSQDASGWPGQASSGPTVFEPDSCKSTHCYSPGTCCLVGFQTQTAL